MEGASNLPALADWLMYGGGAVAVVGILLSAFRSRADAHPGMAQPLAVLGMIVFLIGFVLAVQQGALDLSGIR